MFGRPAWRPSSSASGCLGKVVYNTAGGVEYCAKGHDSPCFFVLCISPLTKNRERAFIHCSVDLIS